MLTDNGGGTCMSVELITENQKRKRKFNPRKKLEILKEWERSGNGIQVAEKYQIHSATLYRWKKALEQGADIILKGRRPRIDPQIKSLEKENQSLKEALAFQSQELMLLKKEMSLV
jgi:transposase-like protein